MKNNTICEMEEDYILTNEQKFILENLFSEITADPYKQYEAFSIQVNGIKNKILELNNFEEFVSVFKKFSNGSFIEKPFLFIKNMPYDENVPVFDNEKPVLSKYELKKTFISEACLALISHLSSSTAIGYVNVNNGDVFQDIYPSKKLQNTQSQKAYQSINFHKDLANHFVRPDYVHMLSIRSPIENSVCTTFVRNLDVYNQFSEEEITLLRSPNFYTPFDDLTVLDGKYDVGEADTHPIFSGDYDIRFFENRTVAVSPVHQGLIDKVIAVMHSMKKRVQMLPGDFIAVANNYSVHGKEIIELNDPEAAWTRWMMKTVNVDDISNHRHHLVVGTNYLIKG